MAKKEYNVVTEVDKQENMKSFTAHAVVLHYRSSYYIKTVYELMVHSNELELKERSRKLESYLIESKSSWTMLLNGKHKILPADSKEWSKENFEALKITLQQCKW
ncbi:hypothetical protein Glove_87g4 [Diversispora epigaea]|uniref:Uncharacterized protein n=1 Tax=Diversispora epigaea TaxID=1348612 RepID=A0A397JGX9_9GLOM|nr:hypothetical protein Glove_87g4 [Diversispora epigaea]